MNEACLNILHRECLHNTDLYALTNPSPSSLCSVLLAYVATDSVEHDGNLYMPKDFLKGIKGVRYSHYGQYISGYADTFEELLTVLDRHAQVGEGGREGSSRGQGSTMEAGELLGPC